MKIEKDFFLLSENAVLDKDNRLTIVNIYDVVNSVSTPAIISRFTLAANFKIVREKKESLSPKIIISISILDPSGQNIFNSPKQERMIDVKKEIQKIGIIANIQGISLPEFGIYHIKLFIDDKEVAQLSFEAKKN